MDDGAADGSQLRINTQSFSTRKYEELIALLQSNFGLAFTLNRHKTLPRLRCRSKSMAPLRQLIWPYLQPEMRYKLPL